MDPNACSASEVSVAIFVDNLNDQAPHFTYASYDATISENPTVGTAITVPNSNIRVYDDDVVSCMSKRVIQKTSASQSSVWDFFVFVWVRMRWEVEGDLGASNS